jgi:ABC-2 type transport system ATP-binding protein
MLTTRVVPSAGRAFLGGVDIVAHPARARQLTGTVSQHNTLDRQLNVWENLYFHGRLFGLGSKRSRRIADELIERSSCPGGPPRRCPRCPAAWRNGS